MNFSGIFLKIYFAIPEGVVSNAFPLICFPSFKVTVISNFSAEANIACYSA